jgi:hypothetical protein
VRGAHPGELDPVVPERLRAEDGDAEEPVLSPFGLDPYYEDAFCPLLQGGMGTCCG